MLLSWNDQARHDRTLRFRIVSACTPAQRFRQTVPGPVSCGSFFSMIFLFLPEKLH